MAIGGDALEEVGVLRGPLAGNAEANMKLSEARVEAVKEYLVKNGINKNRILTKAFGGSQPLFTERTDEAKTKNRRVEVRVIRK